MGDAATNRGSETARRAVQIPVFLWFLVTGVGTDGRRRWFQRIVVANVVMMLVVWLVRLGLDDIPRPSTLTWPQ